MKTGVFLLQKKVKSKSEQSKILIFLAVAGHEQKQQHDHQVFHAEVLWKKLVQKIADTEKGILGWLGWFPPGRRGSGTLLPARIGTGRIPLRLRRR